MRILVITPHYPPFFVGGHDLGCHDIVEGLRRHGHEVEVLTSCPRHQPPGTDNGVHRTLWSDIYRPRQKFKVVDKLIGFGWLLKKERANLRAFYRVFRSFGPELIYIWGINSISIRLAFESEKRCRTAYFVGDPWVSTWETQDVWYRLWRSKGLVSGPKRVIGSWLQAIGFLPEATALEFAFVQFCSHFLRNGALKETALGHTTVIEWGLDLGTFEYRPHITADDSPKLLFAGQIVPHKDPKCAIEALKLLHDGGITKARLTIAGGSVTPRYVEELRSSISQYNLEGFVDWMGQVPRRDLPKLLSQHDILIFSTLRDEGFGLIGIEAQACGCLLVTTATGGTGEFVKHGENALVFAPGDAQGCFRNIIRLVRNPQLAHHLRNTARENVVEKHDLVQMVQKVEGSLTEYLVTCEAERGGV